MDKSSHPTYLAVLRKRLTSSSCANALYCLLAGACGLAMAPAALAFDPQQWASLSKSGQQAYETQNWGKAEKDFLAALDQLRGASDSDKGDHLADSLANLGMLYSSRGQFAKAESYYEKSLKVKEYVLGSYDKGVIASQVKMCQLYLNLNKKEKAMPIVVKLADYGEAQSRELSEVTNSFAKLKRFYQHHKKMDKAAKSLTEAEENTIREMKDQCQDVAILLDGLGTSIKDIGGEQAKSAAERLYKSALGLRQQTLAPDHAALASSLENLGKLYLSEGKEARAEILLRNSYEISAKTLGPDRGETINRLDSLAQILTAEGKLSEAESFYRKVLGNGKDSAAKGSRSQADMSANMAALLVKQGRFSEAVPYYSRALKIEESISGPQSASLSKLLDSYAYALGKSNHSSEAKKLSARARSIRG